jgi:hypothetical protein
VSLNIDELAVERRLKFSDGDEDLEVFPGAGA